MLFIALSYVLGSLPTVAWTAKILTGQDITKVGSGNAGASNLYTLAGRRWALFIFVLELAVKGTLPIVLASSSVFALGPWTQAVAGLAVVTGNTWSPFTKFKGGRSVTILIGGVLGFNAILCVSGLLMTSLIWAATGRKDTSRPTITIILLLPLFTVLFWLWGDTLFGEFDPFYSLGLHVTLYCVGVASITMAKRICALPLREVTAKDGTVIPVRRVLLYRVIFDRDLPSKDDWVTRSFAEKEGQRL